MPKYILFLRDAGSVMPDMSPAEIQEIIRRYVAWRERVQAGGRSVMGHKLRDADGRVMSGKVGAPTVTDGPYAEAREVMGGLFVVDAADYDEAVALARDCPHLEFGTIEVREIEPTG